MLLNIILCEDDKNLLMYYRLIIKNYIKDHPQYDISFPIYTQNPREVESYLDTPPEGINFFILDIEFHDSQTRGLDLAEKIRKLSSIDKIVFLTSYDQFAKMTYERKLQSFDYITKDIGLTNIEKRIDDDLNSTVNELLENDDQPVKFSYSIGPREYKVDLDDIDYFEASDSHKISFHTKDSIEQFQGSLTALESKYENLFRVHKSILINPNNFEELDKHKHKVIFKDGKNCDISRRRVSALIRYINNNN